MYNSPPRLLLIDDQALVRQGLVELFRRCEQIELVAAADAIESAIQPAGHPSFDVILLDVPEEARVFDVAERIIARLPDVKLVFLDERPLDANVREVLRIGAHGYLTKRQPFPQIEAALVQVMRGERVFAPEIARRLTLSHEGVRLGAGDRNNPLTTLTPRETDVLIYVAQGYTVKQCAELLGIGTSTVGNHKTRLMKKLKVHKTVELTRLAMREGLVPAGRGPVAPPHNRALTQGAPSQV